MPSIPEYGEQLRQRRQQLETVRSEVSAQQFQKPLIQQRVLRQLTPFTSLKVKKQIGKMRGEFDISKQAALGEIEQGFREQEQLESEFAPMESEYNEYIRQLQEYEEAKAAEKLASKAGAGGAALYAGLSTGSERKQLQKIQKAYKDYLEAPKLTVSISEQEGQLLPGVIVRDFTKKKMKPEYISPDTGEKFATFAELRKSFEFADVPEGTFGVGELPSYNTGPALTGFAINIAKTPKNVNSKMMGLRPTNINMLGSLNKNIFQIASKKNNLSKYNSTGRQFASPIKKSKTQDLPFFGKVSKKKGIRWL